MLNQVTIQGRLANDPLVNRSGISTKAVFTLAVQDDFNKEKTHWIRCGAWGKTGEFIARYFHKGDMMIAVGQLTTWRKEGEDRDNVEVNVRQTYFGSAKKKEEEDPVEDFNQTGDLPF